MRKKPPKDEPNSTTPHDSLFRSVFSDPKNIVGELQAILPKQLVENIHWPTLRLVSGTQFDAFLSKEEEDLLFTAQFKTGSEAFIYLLFEHLSTPKYWTIFRLLRYMVHTWETYLAQQQTAKKIPVIIPIVLYHGSKPWKHPQSFLEILDVPTSCHKELEPFLPSFRFLLEDLNQLQDEDLRIRASSNVALLALIALKHVRQTANLGAIMAQYRDIFLATRREDQGFQAIYWVMSYIFQVHEAHSEHPILDVIESTLGDDFKEIAMTIADQLIEKGIKRGIQRGREEGKKEGEEKVYDSEGRKLLLALVELKFGPLPTHITNLIQTSSPQKIHLWSTLSLQATTLAEIFTGDLSENS